SASPTASSDASGIARPSPSHHIQPARMGSPRAAQRAKSLALARPGRLACYGPACPFQCARRFSVVRRSVYLRLLSEVVETLQTEARRQGWTLTSLVEETLAFQLEKLAVEKDKLEWRKKRDIAKAIGWLAD